MFLSGIEYATYTGPSKVETFSNTPSSQAPLYLGPGKEVPPVDFRSLTHQSVGYRESASVPLGKLVEVTADQLRPDLGSELRRDYSQPLRPVGFHLDIFSHDGYTDFPAETAVVTLTGPGTWVVVGDVTREASTLLTSTTFTQELYLPAASAEGLMSRMRMFPELAGLRVIQIPTGHGFVIPMGCLHAEPSPATVGYPDRIFGSCRLDT
jgi:hypothetical protein